MMVYLATLFLFRLSPVVKLEFTGVYIIFSYFTKGHDCGCSLEPSQYI